MPCARKSTCPSFAASRLEDVDERRADDLALLLRIGDAGEPLEEQRRRVHEHERQLQPLEPLADLRRLVEPQHAVVDEDAGQPVADRAMNEQRRDRRIDAAAQRRRRRARRRPARGSAPSPPRRTTPSSSRRCSRRRRTRSCAGSRGRARCARLPDGTAARRAARSGSAIAATGAFALVATTAKPAGAAATKSPWLAQTRRSRPARRRRAPRRRRCRSTLHVRVAELALRRRRDRAAERVAPSAACRSRCRAPACRASKTAGSHRGAPGSDTLFGPPDRMMPTGLPRANLLGRRVGRPDLRVDRQLAQPPRDQLRVLRAEIEDDDGLMGHWRMRATVEAAWQSIIDAIIACAGLGTTISCRAFALCVGLLLLVAARSRGRGQTARRRPGCRSPDVWTRAARRRAVSAPARSPTAARVYCRARNSAHRRRRARRRRRPRSSGDSAGSVARRWRADRRRPALRRRADDAIAALARRRRAAGAGSCPRVKTVAPLRLRDDGWLIVVDRRRRSRASRRRRHRSSGGTPPAASELAPGDRRRSRLRAGRRRPRARARRRRPAAGPWERRLARRRDRHRRARRPRLRRRAATSSFYCLGRASGSRRSGRWRTRRAGDRPHRRRRRPCLRRLARQRRARARSATGNQRWTAPSPAADDGVVRRRPRRLRAGGRADKFVLYDRRTRRAGCSRCRRACRRPAGVAADAPRADVYVVTGWLANDWSLTTRAGG